MSNSDCQKLGLVKVMRMGELLRMIMDCLGSFTNMINNLAARIPLEDRDPGHKCPEVEEAVCTNITEDNQYDLNTTPKGESRSKNLKTLPPGIKTIIEGNH